MNQDVGWQMDRITEYKLCWSESSGCLLSWILGIDDDDNDDDDDDDDDYGGDQPGIWGDPDDQPQQQQQQPQQPQEHPID